MYTVTCWGSGLRARDSNRLDRLVRKASSVVGVELDSLAVVSERRIRAKLHAIMSNTSHPIHAELIGSASTFSSRLRLPRCNTERHRTSFIPTAIRLYSVSLCLPASLSTVERDVTLLNGELLPGLSL